MPESEDVQQVEVQLLNEESVLQALVRESALPEPIIVDAANKGALWVSRQRGRGRTKPQRLRAVSEVLAPGSTLMLNYNPQVLASVPLPMRRMSDHVNYSIWYKPSGMLCQGSKWSDHTVATQVAAAQCNRHCFLVHRLDKAACGLMVIAHTKNSLRELNVLFEKRKINKTYQAVVQGSFDKKMPCTIDSPVDDRHALTTVHNAEFDPQHHCSTLRISIHTGRKHQIRKHLAALGHPIVGDRLYSAAECVQRDQLNLQLVACALEFECPFSGEKISTSIDADKALKGEAVS